jgi:MYXO-CTERM domain-containing protein
MRNRQARGRVALLGVATSVLFTAASAHAVATLTMSDAELEPGGTAQVTVTLDDGGDPIAGTSNEIGYPEGLTVDNCEVNDEINKGGTAFTDGNPIIALVLSLTNVDAIPDGSVLYTCDVTAAGDLADGEYTIECGAPAASDPDGNEIAAECVDSIITVVGPPAGAIVIGDAAGLPGATTSIEVTLDVADGQTIVGTENVITFGTPGGTAAAVLQGTNGGSVQLSNCAVNEAINKGGTAFAFQPSGCAEGVDCASLKALVLSLTNVDPIPDDSVMYTCDVAISADAVEGETFALTCSEAGASDAEGGELRVDCVDGTVTVLGEPTPTPTTTPEEPTVAPTEQEDTPTPTVEPTAVPPTSTRTPAFGFDDDGCAIVAQETSSTGWMLLLPLAGLLWLRRRQK